MIGLIKSQIKKVIYPILRVIFKMKIGKFISETFIDLSMKNIKEVNHSGCNIKFVTPNWISRFRIDTFATKEPETLNWISTFEKKTIFWDIGAI